MCGIQVASTYLVFADSVGGELLRVGSNAVLGPCAFRWSLAVSRGGGARAPRSRAWAVSFYGLDPTPCLAPALSDGARRCHVEDPVPRRRMEGRGVAGGGGRRAPPESLGGGARRSNPCSLVPWPSCKGPNG
jgi:hypothetical protein